MISIVPLIDVRTAAAYDAVIDVRSPGEFAEDHVPGAVNLPVLDDAERAQIGTIYVQESRFRARRVGAALVARNIARHLETALEGEAPGFAPLVYCWRGGQRSNAMATVLSQVGWRPTLLEGGYRTWRRHVTSRLYDDPVSLRVVLLDGDTGTAKTAVLGRLAALGVQTLDLERLADHRGSLFGGMGRPQPSQKGFESRLLEALEALDPARPIVVEAESSKVGARMVPPVLWRAMLAAPRIRLRASRPARAAYLVAAYPEMVADRDRLQATIARMPERLGRKLLEQWRALAEAGDFVALAEALMETHYDPAYARSSGKDARTTLATLDIGDLGPEAQSRAAAQIATLLGGRDR